MIKLKYFCCYTSRIQDQVWSVHRIRARTEGSVYKNGTASRATVIWHHLLGQRVQKVTATVCRFRNLFTTRRVVNEFLVDCIRYVLCSVPNMTCGSSGPKIIKDIFIQVWLRTEVLSTPSLTRLGFELVTSRSWQYFSCHHWDACSNHLAISDFKKKQKCSATLS